MSEKLTQGTNKGNLTGILSEKNLERITNSFVPNTQPKVACDTIRGHIIVSTTNGDFRVEVYQNSKTKSGDENKMYTPVLTLFNEYVSKADVAKNPALVADNLSVRVQADVNDYYNDKAKKLITGTRFKFVGCSRADGKESTTGLDLAGFINSIVPETRADGNTGRVFVEFVTFGFGEKAIPFTLVVDEETNEGWFEDNFEVGVSCELKIEPKYVSVGQKKKGVSFGKDVVTSDGFDVLELTVVGAEPPIEAEEHEFYYEPKAVKSALKERKVYLEQLEADGKKGKKPTSTPKAKVSQEDATASFLDDDVPF